MSGYVTLFQIALATDLLGAWGVVAATISAIATIIVASISKGPRKNREHPLRTGNKTRLTKVSLSLDLQSEIGDEILSEDTGVTIAFRVIPQTPTLLSHTSKIIRVRGMKQMPPIPKSATDQAQLEMTLK